jgi:hypothetical protein
MSNLTVYCGSLIVHARDGCSALFGARTSMSRPGATTPAGSWGVGISARDRALAGLSA